MTNILNYKKTLNLVILSDSEVSINLRHILKFFGLNVAFTHF